MPIFKNRGNNHNKAASIISKMRETSPEENTDINQEIPDEVQQNDNIDIPEQEVPNEDIHNQSETDESASLDQLDNEPEEIQEGQTSSGLTESEFLNRVSEMLGREVTNIEDLKPKELDPEVKQLLEWKENTGLSLTQWSNYNKDFSKVSDLDVAREILSQDYPNLDKEELNYVLKDYIYDEEMDDDSDKFKKSIALKKLAQDGRATLKEKQLNLIEDQKKYSLTEEQQSLIQLAKEVQANKEEVQNAQKTYNENLNKAALNLQSLNLDLGDGITIEHKIEDKDKKTLPEMVSKMPHWYNEDGSYNHSNIVKDAYVIKNLKTLITTAYEQGKSVGTEGKIKTDRNINLDSPTVRQEGGNDAPKSNIDDVVAKITGKNKSRLRFRNKKQ